jgi:hypothetical protein
MKLNILWYHGMENFNSVFCESYALIGVLQRAFHVAVNRQIAWLSLGTNIYSTLPHPFIF